MLVQQSTLAAAQGALCFDDVIREGFLAFSRINIDFLNNCEDSALELHFIKTRSAKEIDFVLTDEKDNVSSFIECILSDVAPSYALRETLISHPG